MAHCKDMKQGDSFRCNVCGLELSVKSPCSCSEGEPSCTVPLQCCGRDMVKQ